MTSTRNGRPVPLDPQRIETKRAAIEVGIAQLRAVLPQITRPVIVLADRW